jgi:GNAT superfamily N-acetyltransferase
MQMRLATPDDLVAIVTLLHDDVNGRLREDPSEPLDPGYGAAFKAIAADPNQELLVAERDGAVIGTLQLSFLPGIGFRGAWRGQIESVRVASALRGQGLGGAMIDWAVERCRTRGCRMVQLTSQLDRTGAHRFYERIGWTRSHAGFKMGL